MKRLIEDTFCLTAKEAAAALPNCIESGRVSLQIADRYIQDVVIVCTLSNLEGFVKWFICAACQNRVGKLYLPNEEIVFLCRKCHKLAYRAQQLRAFRRPAKNETEATKKYTKEDWLREAMAFLKKMRSKPTNGLVSSES